MGMAVPSLVMRRVRSCLGGATGEVVVGLEGFTAFLPATLAQVCCGGSVAFGGVGGGRGSHGERFGGARDGGRCAPGGAGSGLERWSATTVLKVLRRACFSSSATLLVRMAIISKRAVLLW